MKTKEIKIYRFEELSEEIQEKVINHFRELNNFDYLEDDLKELLKEKLKEKGLKYFDDLEIGYSLSYYQGDGFSFYGTIETKKARFFIKHSGHYYHANSKEFNLIYLKTKNGEVYSEEIDYKIVEELENKFNNLYISICKELEELGYKIIKEEQDEEYIKETIENGDYYFRENGSIEND